MRYYFSRSLVARQSIRCLLARVLLVVAIAFGLSWVSEARADTPIFTGYQVGYFGTYQGSTPAAACQAAATAQFVTYVSVSAIDPATWGFTCTFTGGPSPANGAAQGGTCATGATPDKTKSLDLQCPSAGPNCSDPTLLNKYVGASVQGTATSLPGTICIQGCAYPAGSVGVQVGTSYATDIGVGTGATCTGANYDTIDTTTKATDPPSLVSCAKQGKVYGTVNGVGICAAAGTIPNSTVTQNGSTTSQGTSASGVQGTPSTSTTTTTVSNVNNVSTVTTTTTNPDGSKSSTTQDQATYCQQNPSAQVCKGSESTASGGADCTTAPSCSGDAIQCMMVNQQWRTRCDSNQPSSLSDLGSQLVNGQDPVANPASSGQRTVNPIASSIDQSSFLGGAGLSDKVVSVAGQAITLPFSRLNQYLVWLGHLFVVMSLIGAIRIVLGGFK